jgi:NitT/TauT family transport system substrate-binding protein
LKFLKRKIIVLSVAVLIVVVILGSFVYLNSQRFYIGNVESVTFGDLPFATSALVYVAQNQNFFAANGISLVVKSSATGQANINALLKNNVDVAYAGEFAFVANGALLGQNISAIGSIVKYQDFYLVARKDRGIQNLNDLTGKKIAVTLNGASEFYLGTLLELNGLNIRNVTLVNLPSSQMVNAITNGAVDAIVTSPPYFEQAQTLLADNAVIWPAQSYQWGYGLLLCRNSWIAQNSNLVVRFLKSLHQAENYIINNPSSAEVILQKELNQTQDFIAQTWPDYQFSLTLDQSLILAMQSEARWLISNNLTNATSVPNFLNYVYVNGLESVNPESVNIIG